MDQFFIGFRMIVFDEGVNFGEGGGSPVRSRVSLRISLSRLASGAGFSPSACSLLRIKWSMGLRAPADSARSGMGVFSTDRKDQCPLQEPPCSIQERISSTSFFFSWSFDFGGGIRSRDFCAVILL